MATMKGDASHQWTAFEEHTILCLICRGAHLPTLSRSQSTNTGTNSNTTATSIQATARTNMHIDFAHKLNHALHGENYTRDIGRQEIALKLERVLREKRGVLPIIERQLGARVTRGIKTMWMRTDRRDFVGDKVEWREGRRERVMGMGKGVGGVEEGESQGQDVTAANTDPMEVDQSSNFRSPTPSPRRTSKSTQVHQSNITKNVSPRASRFRSAKGNSLSAEFVHESDDEMGEKDDGAVQPPVDETSKQNLDSFDSLPANLKNSDKFAWVKQGGRKLAAANRNDGLKLVAAKKLPGEMRYSRGSAAAVDGMDED